MPQDFFKSPIDDANEDLVAPQKITWHLQYLSLIMYFYFFYITLFVFIWIYKWCYRGKLNVANNSR